LPDSFFDLVICVKVLPEINRRLVRFMVDQFHRTLQPGGILYIRDHDHGWQTNTHGVNLNRYLTRNGFELEFRPNVIDGKDVDGIPRIWRKKDPQVVIYRRLSLGERLMRLLREMDCCLRGRISRIYRFICRIRS